MTVKLLCQQRLPWSRTGYLRHTLIDSYTASGLGCNFGAPLTLLGCACAQRGQRQRAFHKIAAAADWGYGSYSPNTNWAGTQGAYLDPRATSGSRPPFPSPQRPNDGPGTSYDGGQAAQDSDPLSEMARMVVDGITSFLASVIGVLSDWALSLLPPHVKRRAVENSVKGALALLGMALLQSVISLVLTVGTVVLAVYTAHQVFGLQLPFLPGTADVDRGCAGPEGASQVGAGAGPVDPRFYGGAGAPPQGGYGPYQQAYGGYFSGYRGQGPVYPPRPGAAGGGAPRGPRGVAQGPVIDVYYESP
ncbi:hypothetical protein Vafri_3817 [Volvox africanus]|uniref:Uncharacterized protein n=1 Tax=Volvox africanus TaxID=51714 RepID=A0A8J4AV54_9CHLO|nr:hypothetical protein Vafri_3817 [Volvox africanus]